MHEIISSSKFNSQLIAELSDQVVYFDFIGTKKSYLADQSKLIEFKSLKRFSDKIRALVLL